MELPVNYHETHWIVRKRIREEYIKQQDNKCYHCHAKLSGEPSHEASHMRVNKNLFPPNFFKWPIHLHHNHDTGMTIGAVHSKCNAILWQYYGE